MSRVEFAEKALFGLMIVFLVLTVGGIFIALIGSVCEAVQ